MCLALPGGDRAAEPEDVQHAVQAAPTSTTWGAVGRTAEEAAAIQALVERGRSAPARVGSTGSRRRHATTM